MTGKVFLVGAGPGDPGLITARGLEVLRSADVVLHDRLVPRELLAEAPPGAEVVYIGKRPGETHSRQLVADALMVERARAGKRVVRLKGGDPFVFGRGGEELLVLVEEGIPFEVVPGVSSAVAAPAYAGIPVTHRGISAGFAAVAANAEALDENDWEALARAPGTVVLMMVARSVGEAVQRLLAGGRDPGTPAAVIESASTPRQRVVEAPLGRLGAAAAEAGVRSPATAIVGDVVGLRAALAWFERRPLHGLRVVVTRPLHQAGELAERLREAGAEAICMPAIAIADPSSFEPLDLAVKKLAEGLYAWVVFASANAVAKLFERLRAAGLDARAFGRTKVAAVGPATASLLAAHGISADFVPPRFTGEELARSMERGTGRVLLPRVEGAPDELPRVLTTAGLIPEEVPAYRNVTAPADTPEAERVRAGDFDVVTFASASAVSAFSEITGGPEAVGLAPDSDGLRFVACIGPSTARRARELGYRVDVIAREHTSAGLVEALAAAFDGTRGTRQWAP